MDYYRSGIIIESPARIVWSAPFFEEIDAILGPRAASHPPLLLDSASSPSGGPELEGKGLKASYSNTIMALLLYYFLLTFRRTPLQSG